MTYWRAYTDACDANVSAKEDYPAERCTFGEYGWINEDVNVLTGIMNKTQAVADGEG